MPSLYREMLSVPPPRIFWPLLALGIVLAVTAAATPALLLMGIRPSLDGDSIDLLVCASLAALLAGLPAWWLFIVRPRRATILSGVVVGIGISITAHPFMWMFIILFEEIEEPSWNPLLQLLSSFSLELLYTEFSLLFVGWITAAIGGVAGGLLIYLQRALTHHWRPRKRISEE